MADQDNSKTNLASQPQGVRDQVALLSFIDNLIKEKNDQSITPEQLPQVKAALLTELNEMINTRMVTLLPEVSQRLLDAMLERKASDQELDKFFSEKIPNLSAEIASVLIDFRAAYLTPIASPTPAVKDEPLMPSPAPITQN